MDEQVFSKLVLNSEQLMAGAKGFTHRRYLFETLDKATGKFYKGIFGLRGIGKTVLLLQLALRRENPLYISADAKYLRPYEIYDIVSYAKGRGYKNIFVDEIHSRPDWTSDLKTLYDEGGVDVFFTGSSSLELRKGADLSRRAVLYELKPASLREYLNIKKGAGINPVTPGELFAYEKRKGLLVEHSKWGGYLYEYCRYGGVLYGDEEREFSKSISNALDKIVMEDLAHLRELDIKVENDIYKLLFKIASSGPFETSYTGLASFLGISKATAIKLVGDLEKVGLLKIVYPCGSPFRKEPKIYLRIPFRYALADMLSREPERGVLREEFFVNNVDVECYFKSERGEKIPDFRAGGKVIEVGGERKAFRGADYIAADGVAFEGNRIPLFLFGFLY